MSASVTREQLEKQSWLFYYNRVLLEQGVLTEKEYRQMMERIKRY